MYNILDLPFHPSGVTHVHRLHRAVGFEKELKQVIELLDLVTKTKNNILSVVVAPYGYGKSEFLDEVYEEAQRRGLKVVRLALTGAFREEALQSLGGKKAGEPLIVLIDEADELSRLAAVHKLGALSYEEFRRAVMDLASVVRALLEPKNYPHVLKNPEDYDQVLIIAALTPQVYYTILKNIIPDVFDITTGRVYREIQIDTRFPFWLYVEIVKSRIQAYSAGSEKGLGPFALHELAALYHIAMKKREVSPRSLLKLTARLYELKMKGGGVADIIIEEGLEIPHREIAEYAISGIPVKNVSEKFKDLFKKVYIYKIRFSDKEGMNIVKELLEMRGIRIDLMDERSVSYEPYLYYTTLEQGDLVVYLFSDKIVEELSDYLFDEGYLVADELGKRIDEGSDLIKVKEDLIRRLQDPSQLIDELENLLGLNGIKFKLCCGKAVWTNTLGFRELFIIAYIDNEESLSNLKDKLNKIIMEGSIESYPIDYLLGFIFSPVLLSEEIERSIGPVLKLSWKNSYLDSSNEFMYISIYGADKLDKIKNKIIKYYINKLLQKEPEPLEFVENAKLSREKLREHVLKYTLALRRGKEKKELSLLKAAEQIISGETPEGMASFGTITEILLRKIGDVIHERELKSLITRLFPVNLWRDIREDDLIALMVYVGLLVPRGERTYTRFTPEASSKYLDELYGQIRKNAEISVSVKSKIFGDIKVVRRIEIEIRNRDFRNREDYAKLVIELKRTLLEIQEKAAEIREELEREAQRKKELAEQLEKIAERLPQRIKFMALDESVLKRETDVVAKVDEIRSIWTSLRPIVSELGDNISVETDLELLLNLPEPWLEEYLALLRIYSSRAREKYEAFKNAARLRDNAASWIRSRLGLASSDIEGTLKLKAEELGVPYQVLWAVASKGPGTELDIDRLAEETSQDKNVILRYLELLSQRGLVIKRYVS